MAKTERNEATSKEPYVVNEFQKIAAQTYADGDYRHLADDPKYATFESHDAFMRHLTGLDDNLFRFIMVELGEDGIDMDEAYNRMSNVHGEFEQILNRFAAIRHGPKPGAGGR